MAEGMATEHMKAAKQHWKWTEVVARTSRSIANLPEPNTTALNKLGAAVAKQRRLVEDGGRAQALGEGSPGDSGSARRQGWRLAAQANGLAEIRCQSCRRGARPLADTHRDGVKALVRRWLSRTLAGGDHARRAA